MLVDQGLGFVVLNFTFSRLPPAEQKFSCTAATNRSARWSPPA